MVFQTKQLIKNDLMKINYTNAVIWYECEMILWNDSICGFEWITLSVWFDGNELSHHHHSTSVVTFWFSVIRRRMNSTSSIMRLFSLLLACRCCRRTSSSFWDLWMASSWGMASVVARGTLPADVRRGCWRDVFFRFPLNEPLVPVTGNNKN